MRKLKHHEQKLLKKVDFLQWKSDQNIREIQVNNRKGQPSAVEWCSGSDLSDLFFPPWQLEQPS